MALDDQDNKPAYPLHAIEGALPEPFRRRLAAFCSAPSRARLGDVLALISTATSNEAGWDIDPISSVVIMGPDGPEKIGAEALEELSEEAFLRAAAACFVAPRQLGGSPDALQVLHTDEDDHTLFGNITIMPDAVLVWQDNLWPIEAGLGDPGAVTCELDGKVGIVVPKAASAHEAIAQQGDIDEAALLLKRLVHIESGTDGTVELRAPRASEAR